LYDLILKLNDSKGGKSIATANAVSKLYIKKLLVRCEFRIKINK